MAPEVELSFVPIAETAEIIAIGRRAANRTCSGTEAADSSFTNRATFMMATGDYFGASLRV
jgi:hypothetical protein